MAASPSCISGSSGGTPPLREPRAKMPALSTLTAALTSRSWTTAARFAAPAFGIVRFAAPRSARRAVLRGVPRGGLYQPSAGPCCLVGELIADLSPALLEDGAVESGLRPDIAPGLVDGAAGRRGHVSDLERLDRNHLEAADHAGRRAVVGVAAAHGGLGAASGRARGCACGAAGCPCGNGRRRVAPGVSLPRRLRRHGRKPPRCSASCACERPKSTPTERPVGSSGCGSTS